MHARNLDDELESPIDLSNVPWEAVREATYLVEQRFSYTYPEAIRQLRHRLVVVPPDRHGDQRLVSYRLDVEPRCPAVFGNDRFGNRIADISADRLEAGVDFNLRAIVRRAGSTGDDGLRTGTTLAPTLSGRADFRETTFLTAADAELGEAAETLGREHDDPTSLARAIVAYVHDTMHYESGATGVGTTAREAFAMRAGVCQDYAHVTLAIARRCGLAARYVSGHLIGEGATHAWVEFALPRRTGEGGVLLALDPTHDRELTYKYVTVAVGRDYGDVAPTSGSYSAAQPGTLTTSNRVEVIGVRFDR